MAYTYIIVLSARVFANLKNLLKIYTQYELGVLYTVSYPFIRWEFFIRRFFRLYSLYEVRPVFVSYEYFHNNMPFFNRRAAPNELERAFRVCNVFSEYHDHDESKYVKIFHQGKAESEVEYYFLIIYARVVVPIPT